MKNILVLGTLDGLKGGVPVYIQNIVNNVKLEDNLRFILASEISEINRENYKNTIFEQFNIRYNFFEIRNKIIQIKRILNKYSISIIHVHTQRAAFLVSLFSIFQKLDIIYTPHGLRHTQLQGINSFLHRLIEIFILNTVSIVTVLSDSELLTVQRLNGNCIVKKINTRINSNLKLIHNEKENSVIMVGTCDSRKQPFLFIDIANKFKNENVSFYWIGTGELLEQCINYVNNNNIQNIHFLGEKSNVETLSILNKCKILLFTSKSEGVPISILEAMSTKSAIISNNYIGYSDLLKHNVNSLIFHNSNVNEAVIFINEILSNYSTYERLSNEALKIFISDYYDVGVFANDYASIYKSIK